MDITNRLGGVWKGEKKKDRKDVVDDTVMPTGRGFKPRFFDLICQTWLTSGPKVVIAFVHYHTIVLERFFVNVCMSAVHLWP